MKRFLYAIELIGCRNLKYSSVFDCLFVTEGFRWNIKIKMNQSQTAGFYGNVSYNGEYYSPDHQFFYSQNRNDVKNPMQPHSPRYQNNWAQNAPNRNNHLAINNIAPKDIINFMENNLRQSPQQNQPNFYNHPEKQAVRGPKTVQEQRANEYINQQLFKNLIKGGLNQPAPQKPGTSQAPPGLVVGTVIAKPKKNRLQNEWGYRVRSEAPEEEQEQR